MTRCRRWISTLPVCRGVCRRSDTAQTVSPRERGDPFKPTNWIPACAGMTSGATEAMEAYILDWLNLLIRWLHLIAGVAWIGASFYFVMLDNSLSSPSRAEDATRGVFGELWAVHGG